MYLRNHYVPRNCNSQRTTGRFQLICSRFREFHIIKRGNPGNGDECDAGTGRESSPRRPRKDRECDRRRIANHDISKLIFNRYCDWINEPVRQGASALRRSKDQFASGSGVNCATERRTRRQGHCTFGKPGVFDCGRISLQPVVVAAAVTAETGRTVARSPHPSNSVKS